MIVTVVRGCIGKIRQVLGSHGATQVEVVSHLLHCIDDGGMVLIIRPFATTTGACAGTGGGGTSSFVLIIRRGIGYLTYGGWRGGGRWWVERVCV